MPYRIILNLKNILTKTLLNQGISEANSLHSVLFPLLFSVLSHSCRRLLASCFCGALVGTVGTFAVLLKMLSALLADGKGHRLEYGLQFLIFRQYSLAKITAQSTA